jgi:hypothetical protein
MKDASDTLTGLKEKHTKIKRKPPGVGLDPVILNATGDEVVWEPPDDGSDFTVHFDVSPFAKKDFHNRDNHSGAPVVHPKPGEEKHFKYSVTTEDGTLDPIVIVRG